MVPVSTKGITVRIIHSCFESRFELTEWYPWPCRSDISGREQRSCPSQFRTTSNEIVSVDMTARVTGVCLPSLPLDP